ncbi:MAG TPA: MATE family efflux transporter [Acholeplasmataceae bacterium]|nr:MATE family efflux transporter [Acholeplasmataceae bacterium]
MNSRKLGEKPIGHLLFTMSIPAIFSMFVQALYNIVDSYFVSKLGSDELNAVSLSFPLQMIIMAVAIGIGIGVNSLIARRKGEHQDKEADEAAKTSIFMAIVMGIIFVVLGLTSARPFLGLITENEKIIDLGTSYLSIVMTFSIWVMLEIVLTKILQAVGNMIIPMLCQLVGAITNIILDPIFIFDFGLGLGIKGAALATVVAQFIAFLLALSMFIFKKQEIDISFKNFKIRKKYIFGILAVGLPVTLINSIGSITTTIMNTLLNNNYPTLEEGEAAVNVLGVYFKLQSFVFMPIFGLNQGAMPILGYNYGANNKPRFIKTLRYMIITTLIIMTIGLIIFQTIPHLLLSIFHPTELMKEIGHRAFRIISLCFIPCSFGIAFAAVFQSIGHGFKSLLMTSFRQIIMIIPSAFILTSFAGINNIWFSYGIAETVTSLIFVPIGLLTINKQFRLRASQLDALKQLA